MSQKVKKYAQKYSKNWESDVELKDWIAPDPTTDTNAMCKYCKVSIKAHYKGLKTHGSTQKHKSMVEKDRSAKQCVKLNTVFTPYVSEVTKVAELKLAAFIAEHASIQTVDHLSELLPNLDKKQDVLSKIHLHRTKCSMVIKNILGPCMFKNLVEEVGESAYSLIIDETTDLSTNKILCIMIRFFSKKTKEIVTTFFRLIKLSACDASSLCRALKAQLKEDGLNIQNMVGIGVDGANVMVGCHNSVASILKEELDDLFVIKCICHSLHLCAEYATKELPQELEFLVRETHNWFSYSPKRIEQYTMLYSAINNQAKQKKIQGLSGTRWLARFCAIETILDQWVELDLLFSIAKTQDKCYMAGNLSNLMRKKQNKLYLMFLKNELKEITQLNMLFQSNNVHAHKLFEDLFLFYKHLLRKITKPERLSRISDEELIEFEFQDFLIDVQYVYFGFDFETESRDIDEVSLLEIRKNCFNFYIVLAEQVKKRLPDNIDILKTIACLDPQVATAQIKPSFKHVLHKISRFNVFGRTNFIEEEWNKLQNKQWSKLESPESFFSEVYEDTDAAGLQRFENISKFALALLSLPISNAEVERAFSIYALLKTKLRNKLSIPMLNSLMTIRYTLKRNGNCTKFEPNSEMLKLFNYKMYDFKNSEQEINEDIDTLNEINTIQM